VQGGALALFRAHPFTGIGLGNIAPYLGGASVRDGQNAQNYLYQVLAEAGLFAGLALIVLFGALAWVAVRALIAYRPVAAMLLAEIVVIVVVCSTDANFRLLQVSAFAAVIFGIGASLGTSYEVRRAHDRALASDDLSEAAPVVARGSRS
jgi:O-antigen ligase